MKNRDELKTEYTERREHLSRRPLLRLRFYFVLMLIEFVVVVVAEVANGSFAITSALFFGAVGFIIGIILTRRFHLSWDEKTDTMAGSTDVIGATKPRGRLLFTSQF